MKNLYRLFLVLFMSTCVHAQESATNDGEVTVPLPIFTQLLNATRVDPRPAPTGYAIGVADIDVDLSSVGERSSARVVASFSVDILENEWTLIPLLAAGVALTSAQVDGQPAQLVSGPDGLAWSTAKSGTVHLRLEFNVDARRAAQGYFLNVPVPRAAATNVTVSHPRSDIEVSIVPGENIRRLEKAEGSHFTASLPSTSTLMLSWQLPSDQPYTLARAKYRGHLQGNALSWTALFDVEVFDTNIVKVPLMTSTVTLGELLIDGQRATVIEQNGRFATVIQGAGLHRVEVRFQVPIITGDGPPKAAVLIPRVPISHFELTLPGNKELSVSPHSNVTTTEGSEETFAEVYVPMTEQVMFSWVDAVPAELRAQTRANASVYHIVQAEEGVLHTRAFALYEITRGETNQLTLLAPINAQINRIVSPNGGVSDWSESVTEDQKLKKLDVYLDRAVDQQVVLDISYEILLGESELQSQAIAVPLLSAVDVHRQRGMIALLAGSELTLEPASEERVSRVGENQIPAFVRNQITSSVVHTYKYTDRKSGLSVRPVAPQRLQGKFDAAVDTLISIGEVALKGSSSISFNVKSGTLLDLELRVPANVNVFGVTGPSIRSHQITSTDDAQIISIEFTQEMEGQFRLDVNYERIMADGELLTAVPTISVSGADVEHGRIAVEALSALEVKATVSEQLSSLDLNELPQQLLLKTTNPILLAYKYVHAEPPFQLNLKITRHKEIDVQVAAIEIAKYSTLFTRDGLAVSKASFIVRNNRRQFLRLELPQDSTIWSVFVDGAPEKPAHASEDGDGDVVLIKMKNSSRGFPVEIVYATRVDGMGSVGSIGARLPNPDMVVTHSRWDVFLPANYTYRKPNSSLDLVAGGQRVNAQAIKEQSSLGGDANGRSEIGAALKISIPAQGIHYAFEKLYANESPDAARFDIAYTSAESNRLSLFVSLAGVVLIWLAIFALGSRRLAVPRAIAIGVFALGAALVIASIGYMGTNPTPASALAMVIALLFVIGLGARKLLAWRRR